MTNINKLREAQRERERLEESPEYLLKLIRAKNMEMEEKLAQLRKLMEPTQVPPYFEGFTIKEKTTK